jgi:hypothetical protein
VRRGALHVEAQRRDRWQRWNASSGSDSGLAAVCVVSPIKLQLVAAGVSRTASPQGDGPVYWEDHALRPSASRCAVPARLRVGVNARRCVLCGFLRAHYDDHQRQFASSMHRVALRCRRHCVHCLTAPTAWTCEAHCRCDAAACAQTLQRAPFIHGIERHGAAEHVTTCNIHQGSGNIARHDDHATQRPGLRNSPAPAACWLNIEAAFQRASS